MMLLDLFSGIGGFSLGLERSQGFKTVAFCECEPFCRKVLTKHWPKVPIYDDVRSLTAEVLERDGITVDAICGGFPCQDISTAGLNAGIEGARSGLWREFARLIGELRPRVAIMENVAALRNRGLSVILGELAALGYDAEWHCIPASAVGAPHQRDRIWIVAHPTHIPEREQATKAHAVTARGQARHELGGSGEHLAHARSEGLQAPKQEILCGTGWREKGGATSQRCWWAVEPNVGRVAHGVPARVDRLKGLGNSLVPQIPELLGRAIMEAGL